MAVALFTGDEILWKINLGKSTYGFPVNDSTLFSIQSVSKNMTALAVMMATEEGLVSLDSPIKDYLPGFTVNSCFDENPTEKITLRMLLSHTSGLPHEAPVGNNYDFSFPSQEGHLASISESWLRFPPGTGYSYSNQGYDLAAQIIEAASGKSFFEYIDHKLFQPSGMKHSTLNGEKFRKEYNKTEGVMNSVRVKHYPIPLIGAGTVYSCLSDMVKYTRIHLNNGMHKGMQIAGNASLKEMYMVMLNNYGLGTYTDSLEGSWYLNHNGGGYGFGASMIWFPEYNIGCVVLANKAVDCYSLASSLISQYLQLTNPDRIKDTKRTEGFYPLVNKEMPVISGTNFCRGDSDYKEAWDVYTGDYELLYGGMEYKWYARLAFSLGYRPNKIKVVRKENELWLTGNFGESKLYEHLPGIFFTRSGSTLNLQKTPSTFNNITLKKYR